MLLQPLDLPGAITLVLGRNVPDKARQQRLQHPSLPASPGDWVNDLNALSGGVPSTVRPPSTGDGNPSVVLHLDRYYLVLYLRRPTSRSTGRERIDAYTLGAVGPLRARDHDRLADGCLLLRAVRWELVTTPAMIPPGAESYWSTIEREYNTLRGRPATSPADGSITTGRAAYLDRVDAMIDATRRIQQADGKRPTYPYAAIDTASERRYARRSVYRFRLAGGRAPELRTFVEVVGGPATQGQVTHIDDTTLAVTVSFDAGIDHDLLPPQGHLITAANSIVHRSEREAVDALRNGQSRNTGLLAALVDGEVAPLTPAMAEPDEQLDQAQREAFSKAVAVEDLLLIQGPPGTGKTRVITEIAEACAHRGERVLVTSHTNRAVDNVLARLPEGLLVIRVGNADQVTEEGRAYLLDRQVGDLRDGVANSVDRALSAYGDLDHARGWLDVLTERTSQLGTALDEHSSAATHLERLSRAVGGRAQVRIDAVTSRLDRLTDGIEQRNRRIEELTVLRDRAAARRGWFLVGRFHAAKARGLDNQLDEANVAVAADQDRMRNLTIELAAAEQERDRAATTDPAVRDATDALSRATDAADQVLATALEAAETIRATLAVLTTTPPVTSDDPGQTHRDLVALAEWLTGHLPVLATRGRLLTEWRDEIAGTTDGLHPELVRYANVLAATAIGSASRSELSGVELDVAIVDEAGQIGVADIIIPLVRATRGVLVGDHHQLPPFLDSEVEAWGADLDDPAIRNLLTKSAFELLADPGHLPTDNVVRLRTQRRMPPSIAVFISRTFYDDWLTSDTTEPDPDRLFNRALTLIDTSDLPDPLRWETQAGQGERWGLPGCSNKVEAELLIRLATHYHRLHGGDAWAVIVPYRAQVARIAPQLGRLINDASLANLNVGTVDSFQGGERPVVLYGFTRSNSHGRVGFLIERRRLNVAFTRARQRLIAIGDFSTLTTATNGPFRDLARAFRYHAQQAGELLDHGTVTRLLDRHDPNGSNQVGGRR
jgi:KaiC/GvpD/RAD55 family RecA-like ATPase